MKVQETVRRETGWVALGTAALTAVELIVYLALRRFSAGVALGAVWGAATAVLNFFLLGLSVQRAAASMSGVQVEETEPPEDTDEKPRQERARVESANPEIRQARRQMQASYGARMLLTGACLAAAFLIPFMDGIAAVFPLFFPRLVISLRGTLTGKENEKT